MKVAVLIDDLFFTSKVSATAKQIGADIVFCRRAADVPRDASHVCVDLNASAFDPVAEIRELKSKVAIPVVAFVSHVQIELKRAAEEAGADRVMSRSEFSQNLVKVLSRT